MSTENPSNGAKPPVIVVETSESLYGKPAQTQEAAPAPEETRTQQDPEANDGAVTAEEGADDTSESAGGTEESSVEKAKKNTPKGVQVRLDELTKRAHEAERRLERALEIIERQASKPAADDDFEPVPDRPGIPAKDQYRSEAEYLDALVEHRITQREAAKAQAEAKAKVDAAESVARAKYDDYETAVQRFIRSPLAKNPIIIDAIYASDVGPEIAYQIGSDAGALAELAKLPAHRIAARLAQIEDELSGTKQAEAPKAKPKAEPKPLPNPPAQIQGTALPADPMAVESPHVDHATIAARVAATRKRYIEMGQKPPY
jgi:hypothetical protein